MDLADAVDIALAHRDPKIAPGKKHSNRRAANAKLRGSLPPPKPEPDEPNGNLCLVCGAPVYGRTVKLTCSDICQRRRAAKQFRDKYEARCKARQT